MGEDRTKRRARQRRYWALKGWARRRERRLVLQRERVVKELDAVNEEARQLGLS